MPKRNPESPSGKGEEVGLHNKLTLFPQIAQETINATDRFFTQWDSSVKALNSRELESYKYHHFIAGWETRIRVSERNFQIRILLDHSVPFSAPRVALRDEANFLIWPHIEKMGLLCLRHPDDSLIHKPGSGLVEYYLKEAAKLLQENEEDENIKDFAAEFQSYWNYWCEKRNGSRSQIVFFGEPGPPTRVVYYVSTGNQIVICDSIPMGKKWAREISQRPEPEDDDFRKAGFFWLESSIVPNEYPKNNADVALLVKKKTNTGIKILRSLIPNEPGSIDLIFGFESGNGPALAFLRLNEPIKAFSSKKGRYRRFNGFRNRPSMNPYFAGRYFSAEGKADPAPVQRSDGNWIFERGGRGLHRRILNAKVCMIGCGSLGAQVAKTLAQTGISKLTLIDKDILSWDNIGRHLLGGSEVGQKKVNALKKYLERHFPGITDIQIEPKTWQEVFINEPAILLGSNIIVSTTADWDAESALNYAFNTEVDFPPVVYGWTEPYGFVGHALAVMGVGGCLSCGMDPYGNFSYEITQWDDSVITKRPPACGVTYQPYGVIDIIPTQNMIARLVLDILLGKVKKSQHRSWIGNLDSLTDMDGKLADGLQKYYGAIGEGERFITRDWKIQDNCQYNH